MHIFENYITTFDSNDFYIKTYFVSEKLKHKPSQIRWDFILQRSVTSYCTIQMFFTFAQIFFHFFFLLFPFLIIINESKSHYH